MNRKLKPDFCLQDERGNLVQLVHEGYDQVNVLFSKKGVLRGEHFHKLSTESFYVVTGSVIVSFEMENNIEKETYIAGDFFNVLPNEKHSLYFPEDCWMIALYDKAIENLDGSKDIHTEH